MANVTFKAYHQLNSQNGFVLFQAWLELDEATWKTLPKYLGVRNSGRFCVGIRLDADKVNGGKNEAGIKRIRKFISLFPEANYEVNAINSYPTFEDFKIANEI